MRSLCSQTKQKNTPAAENLQPTMKGRRIQSCRTVSNHVKGDRERRDGGGRRGNVCRGVHLYPQQVFSAPDQEPPRLPYPVNDQLTPHQCSLRPKDSRNVEAEAEGASNTESSWEEEQANMENRTSSFTEIPWEVTLIFTSWTIITVKHGQSCTLE